MCKTLKIDKVYVYTETIARKGSSKTLKISKRSVYTSLCYVHNVQNSVRIQSGNPGIRQA
jgi:hypothetical protein